MADEAGASAVEYGLLVALIAASLIAVLGTIGVSLADMLGFVAGLLGSSPGAS